MNHTATLIISQGEKNAFEAAMAGLDYNFKLDELVARLEVEFDNGMIGLLSVVSGNDETVGFVDSCLIDDEGEEFAVLPPAIDTLTGVYTWAVGDDTYTLNLVTE